MDREKEQRRVQDYEVIESNLAAETGVASARLLETIEKSPTETSAMAPARRRRYDTLKSSADEESPDLDPSGERSTQSLDEDKADPSSLTIVERYISWRYVMVLLLNLSWLIFIFIRNSMPMALVCMAAPVALIAASEEEEASGLGLSLAYHNITGEAALLGEELYEGSLEVYNEFSSGRNISISALMDKYEFEWSAQIQGLVLTSITVLTFASPLLGSYLQTKMSSRYMLALISLALGGLTILTPVAARTNAYVLIALRVLIGLFLGANAPVMGDTVAWWGPQKEKLVMMSLSFVGVNFGEILMPIVAGFMCLIPVDNGWPFLFYVFGGLPILWAFAWFFLSAPRPEDHRFISAKERDYIVANRSNMGDKEKIKAPLRDILTSVPVLSYIFTGCCHRWNSLVVMTSLPLFFKDILRFSVQQTGILISIVCVFRMCGSMSWVVISNILDTYLGVRMARKICVVSGLGLSGVILMVISFLSSHSVRWYFFFFLLPAMMSQGSGGTTLTAVALDMAPRFGGILTSLFVSTSAFCSFSGPLIVSIMTKTGSAAEWQRAWFLMGSIYFIGAIVFLIFANAGLQPWAMADCGVPKDELEKPDTLMEGWELNGGGAKNLYGGVGNNHHHEHPSKEVNGVPKSGQTAGQDLFRDVDEEKLLEEEEEIEVYTDASPTVKNGQMSRVANGKFSNGHLGQGQTHKKGANLKTDAAMSEN